MYRFLSHSLLFNNLLNRSITSSVDSVPSSTSRRPRRPHRGPGKRQTSEREEAWWDFVRAWANTMQGEESSKHSWMMKTKAVTVSNPKAASVASTSNTFATVDVSQSWHGNESVTDICWPYALLRQLPYRLHPFTMSIKVYYSQYSLSSVMLTKKEQIVGETMTKDANNLSQRLRIDKGNISSVSSTLNNLLAQQISQEMLVPLAWHNPQCHVESELLVQYSDRPWLVLTCLDGTQRILPIRVHGNLSKEQQNQQDNVERQKLSTESTQPRENHQRESQSSPQDQPSDHSSSVFSALSRAKYQCLQQLMDASHQLGHVSSSLAKDTRRVLMERPQQCQSLQVDYQWLGEEVQEREQWRHLLQWSQQTGLTERGRVSVGAPKRVSERTVNGGVSSDPTLVDSNLQQQRNHPSLSSQHDSMKRDLTISNYPSPDLVTSMNASTLRNIKPMAAIDEPNMLYRREQISSWLSFDGGMSLSPAQMGAMKGMNQHRLLRGNKRQRDTAAKMRFFQSGTRMHARHSRYQTGQIQSKQR